MRLDSHLHICASSNSGYGGISKQDQNSLLNKMKEGGIDGGVILSVNPLTFKNWSTEKRLKDVMSACDGADTLYPFYWINPLEEDAVSQVDQAVSAGIKGFKMTCSEYLPSSTACMDVLNRIAQVNKPVLFHSGILWDGKPSANNNRPGNFEALLDIPKLKFALAHISWPWCDECIAVFGKFNNAYHRNPNVSCEMFVDVTPGTPRKWREEVFRHLFYSEYEFRYSLMFGTDSIATNYNTSWAAEWQLRDDDLYRKFVDDNVEDWLDHVYHKNLMRFMGLSEETPVKKIPLAGQ